MSPDEFARRFPTLYHVAWPEARDRIREEGLLSPLALAESLGLSEADREAVLSGTRPVITTLAPDVILNDNSPLQSGPLLRCLRNGLAPDDWKRALNSRVFLFTKGREARAFANAAASRDRARDVWAFDGLAFVEHFLDRMEVTPFNTGATTRKPPMRDLSTFAPVAGLDFEEWRMRRARAGEKTTPDTVREVCVRHSAPDAVRVAGGRLL